MPVRWQPKEHTMDILSNKGAVEMERSGNGKSGFVHETVMNDFENLIDFEVYACGPPVMVKAAAKSCIENKLKKENFFSDSFEYANVSTDND